MSEEINLSVEVPADLGGYRLDQAMAKLFPEYSRSRLQSWIKKGELLVDGKQLRPRDKLVGGETIEVGAQLEAVLHAHHQSALLDASF